MVNNRSIANGWIGLLLETGALLLVSVETPCTAATIILPPYKHVFFQTSSPDTPVDNGDWWTNLDYGSQPHKFYRETPPRADRTFVLTVQFSDPEYYETDGEMDLIKNKPLERQLWLSSPENTLPNCHKE